MKTLTSPPWQIELYTTDPDITSEVLKAQLEKESEEYTELGLDLLAQQSKQQARAIGAPSGTLLSKADLAVWHFRYPTIYTTDTSSGNPVFLQIFGHRFPSRFREWRMLPWWIPTEIRKLIGPLRPAFESLEIWTPEFDPAQPTLASPILIGRRGDRAYLLARWAEALEPWESLCAKARSREGRWAMRVRWWAVRREPMVMAAVAAGVVPGVLAAILASNHPGIAFGLATLAVLTAGWLSLWWPSKGRICRAAAYAGWILPDGF